MPTYIDSAKFRQLLHDAEWAKVAGNENARAESLSDMSDLAVRSLRSLAEDAGMDATDLLDFMARELQIAREERCSKHDLTKFLESTRRQGRPGFRGANRAMKIAAFAQFVGKGLLL